MERQLFDPDGDVGTGGGILRAITLWQPYAQLIALGAKTIETRSWDTTHRGLLAIHAAKREPADTMWTGDIARTLQQHAMTPKSLPRSAVVAICRVVDVVQVSTRVRWHDDDADWHEDPASGLRIPLAQREYGDFTEGRYLWLLDDIVEIDPVPAQGKQGFWNWERPSIAA